MKILALLKRMIKSLAKLLRPKKTHNKYKLEREETFNQGLFHEDPTKYKLKNNSRDNSAHWKSRAGPWQMK